MSVRLRFLLVTLMAIMLSANSYALNKKLFISFSMPNQLLEQLAHQATRLHIPLVLNGLHQNSMRKTLSKIFDLAQKEKDLSIQIDPVSFKKYGITRVPALVVDDGETFDVVRGNIRISDMLALIKDKGEAHA